MNNKGNNNNNCINNNKGNNKNKTNDTDENDYKELVPFNPSCYPDGANGAMYMRPASSPSRNCTHD